ncbi:MAG: hypothetical protein ACFCU5_17275, partial [Pleurocapsa sp.]
MKEQLIIADAHVHLHDYFDLNLLFDSALNNFHNHAQKEANRDNYAAILLLTEISGQNKFNEVKKYTLGDNQLENWNVSTTQENVSLSISDRSNRHLFLIAGRQIVTAENLEVLALITEENFTDGLSLEVTIHQIIQSNGIPVLPWGVGKWMGQRGKLLNKLLAENNFPMMFLGDNSGRPVFWSRPVQFQQAEKQGMRILPGTDPLPLNSEVSRPGSFGFTIKNSLNCDRPGEHLKQMLLDPHISLQPYGSLESPLRFVCNQLAMR